MNFRRGYGVLALSACSAFVCTVLPGQDAADPRLPIPEKAKLAQAVKLIKDIFKDEYAKRDLASRAALAAKLLEQAGEEREATSKYALLTEARKLAEQGGAPVTALKAVGRMAKQFRINGSKEKLATLRASSRGVRSADQARELVDAYLAIGNEAIAKDDLSSAETAALAAQPYARAAKSLPLFNRVSARIKEVRRLKSALLNVRKALETLKSHPDDPKANTEVGKYRCWVKGDWEKGLPLLAKGGDQVLAGLAGKDMKRPVHADEQLAVADGWWKYATKTGGPATGIVRKRAAYWYKKALLRLTGLRAARVEKLLLENFHNNRSVQSNLTKFMTRWHVKIYRGGWQKRPLSAMKITLEKEGISVTNTTGIHTTSILSYDIPLSGDFLCTITCDLDRSVEFGILKNNDSSYFGRLPSGKNMKIIFKRVGPTVTLTCNGRKIGTQGWSGANSSLNGYLKIQLQQGQTIVIREFKIDP